MLIDNKYQVIKKLGKGAQGEVMLVKKAGSDNQLFALKSIHSDNSDNLKYEEATTFFINEFKLIKNLEHPNIIKVHDFGFWQEEAKYYYTMDYIEGMNLFDFFAAKDCETDIIADVLYKLLCGLNYLHANNVVHFDIKPENILIQNLDDKLSVKLLDFGLAGLNNLDKHKIRGTLCYMAPELFIPNSTVGSKIDLYSLGVTILMAVNRQKSLPTTSLNTSGILSKTKSVQNFNLESLANLNNKKLRDYLKILIEPDPALRINSAYEAIVELNDRFGKSYPLPAVWSIDSCEFNSRFLIRENLFQQITTSNSVPNLLLSGESGCGLSKLLQRLAYHFSLNLLKVVYLDKTDIDNSPLNKLQFEINSIHQSLRRKNHELDIESERELPDQLIEQIQSVTEKTQLYILIDDFGLFDTTFATQIDKLAALKLPNCKLIATHTTKFIDNQPDAKTQILNDDPNFKHLELPSLTKSDIDKLIKDLFSKIINLPHDFSLEILKSTAGNFRLIMQKLDAFINKKIITGYQELFIYSDSDNQAEQIFKAGNAKNIYNQSTKLIIMSLLFAPLGLPREILSVISGLDSFALQKQLDQLTNQAVLRVRLINDRKYYYLLERYSHLKLISLKHKKLSQVINTVIADTTKTIQFRSPEEQIYLAIVSSFLQPEPEIMQILPQVISNKESRVKEFYLTIATELVHEPSAKLTLLYELTKDLIAKSKLKQAIVYLNKIKKLLGKDTANPNYWQLVYLQVLLHDDTHYSIKPTYFLKQYALLESKLQLSEFLDIAIKMVESFLQSRYAKLSKKIISAIKNSINQHPNSNYRFAKYLLESYEIFYNIIPWQDDNLSVIERYLDDFVQNSVFTHQYFKTLYNFVSYFTLFKNNSTNTRFLKYLQQGLVHARESQHYDYLLMLSNHLGLYYRNTAQYPAAIKIYENILNNEKMVLNLNRSNIINNLALIKYDTQMPVGEVQYLFQEACAEQRRYASLSSYSVQLSNISVVNFESGNFPEAAKYLEDELHYFSYLGSIYHLPILNYIPKYASYFINKETLLNKITAVYKQDLTAVIDRVEKCYDYIINNNLENFYPPEVINTEGNFRLESLEVTLYLTIKNKKLPESKTMLNNVGDRFLSENHLEDHLVYQMLRFIYSPSDNRSEIILKLLQKLQLNGYRWIACQHLTRFLIFVIIAKIDLKDSAIYYQLLKDNLDLIINRCSELQKEHFRHTYLAKTALKLLKKHFCF